MTAHSFTLILGGFSDLTDEMANAVFEAGCDDALLGTCEGVTSLDFDREAPSFLDAVLSAIHDVKKAGIGAWVVRVEPDEMVTASEIARRTSRTREGIRLLARGRRGPGGFPAPISNLAARSRLWSWSEVARWFAEHYDAPEQDEERASVIAAINAALDLHRHVPRTVDVERLWSALKVKERPTERCAWLDDL